MRTTIFTVLYFLMYLIDHYEKFHDKKRYAKLCILPCLIIAYITKLPVLILIGLVLGWAGDILLLFKEKKYFIAGSVSFMIGHLCYCMYFLQQPLSLNYRYTPLLILYALIAGTLLNERLKSKYKPIVAVYAVPLVLSCILAMQTHNDWAILGTSLFVVSDTLVAHEKFIQAKDLKTRWIMFTYVLAQYCIVLATVS